jgi:hypothetical protein
VDANAHYTTAIELARLTGDVFWHAGALEGSVCALVVSLSILHLKCLHLFLNLTWHEIHGNLPMTILGDYILLMNR